MRVEFEVFPKNEKEHMPSGMSSPIVVLGVGDMLRRDEGVGVHIVRALAQNGIADRIELVDGGNAVFEALSPWSEIGKLVVVDALSAGRIPGSISRNSLRELTEMTVPKLSLHEQELFTALAQLCNAGLTVGEVIIFGVEPAEMDWGTELSEAVAECLPRLAERIVQEISAPTTQFGLA